MTITNEFPLRENLAKSIVLLVQTQRTDENPASILESPPGRGSRRHAEFIVLLAASEGDSVNSVFAFAEVYYTGSEFLLVLPISSGNIDST